MSSSTALLPKDRKNDDHPIFLRVCHSPWYNISQKCLIAMRSAIAAYMFAGFLSIIDYERNRLHSDWVAAFKFSNVSYGIQLLYQGIAAIWPLMHLYYPHHSNENSYSNTMKKFLSPPKQTADSSSRAWFSIFYSAATTWPIVAAIMHWGVMVPTHHAVIPGHHTFGEDEYTTFFVFNKYVISAAIALFEIFFLSSIKMAQPIGAHLAGLSALCSAYIGWAYVGYEFTGKYVWWFLDHNQVEWRYVYGSWAAFAALTQLAFGFTQALTAVRGMFTKKHEHQGRGYQALPQ